MNLSLVIRLDWSSHMTKTTRCSLGKKKKNPDAITISTGFDKRQSKIPLVAGDLPKVIEC